VGRTTLTGSKLTEGYIESKEEVNTMIKNMDVIVTHKENRVREALNKVDQEPGNDISTVYKKVIGLIYN